MNGVNCVSGLSWVIGDIGMHELRGRMDCVLTYVVMGFEANELDCL